VRAVLPPHHDKVTIESYLENPGDWMYHCHIPEHAELGMMAQIRVNP
jgi:suppressor of ftsI